MIWARLPVGARPKVSQVEACHSGSHFESVCRALFFIESERANAFR
jgi:hypothetical protein